ncbi:MAG: DUF6537 domain-containing protein [Woeseiaceae bacterium]|nr:DUF6537 domain-containing protein [Woeseiaceae bacterium]
MPAIANQVRAEGVERIAIVSDEPRQIRPTRAGTPRCRQLSPPRTTCDALQRELREISGVTVLIYDQTCATAKAPARRRRGLLEDPDRFAVINELVCEALRRLLGRIELPVGRPEGNAVRPQAANRPEQLQQGLLVPERLLSSFVTVEGGKPARLRDDARPPYPEQRIHALPQPALPATGDSYDLLVTGVGGTGVITVGALITMAAHVEGKGASVLDFTGFAQKFGPVLSYIRLADTETDLNQVRIGAQQADALIGCDLVVSSSPKASSTYRPGHTRVAVNTAEMSTADFVQHRDANLKAAERIDAIRAVVGRDNLHAIAANELADRLLGNTIYANVLMLGAAWQHGLVPVSLAALLRAIELNGVDVERNHQAFHYGRLVAAAPAFVAGLVEPPAAESAAQESPEDALERRRAFLVDYPGRQARATLHRPGRARAVRGSGAGGGRRPAADGRRNACLVQDTGLQGRVRGGPTAHRHRFPGAVAARLRRAGRRSRFHLAPPVLNGKRDARGRPLKKEFGAWIIPAFRLLAKLRVLRGTRLDLFGMTAERRMERALIREFEDTVDRLLPLLTRDNVGHAADIVRLFLEVRGYGPVKEEAVASVRQRLEDELSTFGAPRQQAA